MRTQSRRHWSEKTINNFFDIFRPSSNLPVLAEKVASSTWSSQSTVRSIATHSAEQLVFPKLDVVDVESALQACNTKADVVGSIESLSRVPTLTLTRSNSIVMDSTDDSMARARTLTRSNSVQMETRPQSREHSIAARTRAQLALERPRSRSNSLRSSRNRSSSAADTSNHEHTTLRTDNSHIGSDSARRSYQRRTIPEKLLRQAPPYPAEYDSISKRKTIHLPFSLTVVPASPDTPRFNEVHLRFVNKDRQRVRSHRNAQIIETLLWDKDHKAPSFKRPQLLASGSLKSKPSTFVNSTPAIRNLRDVTHVPASAKWFAWNLYIDERAPLIFSQIQVARKYSTQVEVPERPCTPSIFGWTKGQHHSILPDSPAKVRPIDTSKQNAKPCDRSSGFWSLL